MCVCGNGIIKIRSCNVYAVRRGLDVAGIPVRNHSFGAREAESPMKRKPFSPISSTTSSKTNLTNFSEDPNILHNDTIQKALPANNMPFTTPSKVTALVAEEENMPFATPKVMPIPVPATPLTVSVPMQTAMTPAPPQSVPYASNLVEENAEEIEYSFEERRAGFVLPKTHLKSMIQV